MKDNRNNFEALNLVEEEVKIPSNNVPPSPCEDSKASPGLLKDLIPPLQDSPVLLISEIDSSSNEGKFHSLGHLELALPFPI